MKRAEAFRVCTLVYEDRLGILLEQYLLRWGKREGSLGKTFLWESENAGGKKMHHDLSTSNPSQPPPSFNVSCLLLALSLIPKAKHRSVIVFEHADDTIEQAPPTPSSLTRLRLE